MKPIKVGILGLGTVGAGVYQVLVRNQQEIMRRAGCAIEVAMVCRRDVVAARGIVGDKVELLTPVDPKAQWVASGAGFLNDGDLVRVVASSAAPASGGAAPASAAAPAVAASK